LETAMPISPARVQASGYLATGLDLASAVVIEQLTEFHAASSHDDEIRAEFSMLEGLKIGVSATPKIDLIAKYFVSEGHGNDNLFYAYSLYRHNDKTKGYKLGCKALLYSNKKEYVAFMPLFARVRGVSTEQWVDNYQEVPIEYNYKNLFNSDGFEAQMLYTYKAGKIVQFTVAGKYNYNVYSEEYRNRQSKKYYVKHYGITGNMNITISHAFLMLEIGNEFVPVINGNLTNQPLFGLCVGFKL